MLLIDCRTEAVPGARPSAYMDQPGRRWTAFHAYDPDGNRLNFWSYC